jgi:hypothetical protein
VKNNTKGYRTIYITNQKTGKRYGPFRIKDVINEKTGKYTTEYCGKEGKPDKRGRKKGYRKRREQLII